MTKSTFELNSFFERNNFSDMLARAGVTVEEAARLFKVSRVTIYTWRDGHAPNQQLILDRAERIITAINKATAAGDLPIINLEKDAKYQKLAETLRKHLG